MHNAAAHASAYHSPITLGSPALGVQKDQVGISASAGALYASTIFLGAHALHAQRAVGLGSRWLMRSPCGAGIVNSISVMPITSGQRGVMYRCCHLACHVTHTRLISGWSVAYDAGRRQRAPMASCPGWLAWCAPALASSMHQCAMHATPERRQQSQAPASSCCACPATSPMQGKEVVSC